MQLNLIILKDIFAIYRFNSNEAIPERIEDSNFYSVTRTSDELSVVCKQSDSIEGELAVNKDWRVLKIEGHLDFLLVGIIADISGLLKERNIPIFTISTYDTDYFLVRNRDLDKAVDSLKSGRYIITFEN